MPTTEPLSALPTAGTLTGTEIIPLVQAGTTKTVAASAIAALFAGNAPTATTATNQSGGTVAAATALSKANGAVAGYMPPLYSPLGTATAATEHIVRGRSSVPIPSGLAGSLFTPAAVTLYTPAIFSDVLSYQLFVTLDITGSSLPSGWTWLITTLATRISGSQFQIQVGSQTASTSTGVIIVDWLAVGY